MDSKQKEAVRRVPRCVDMEHMDGTWEHVVFRVEHPVDVRSEGEDLYTLREARNCQRWLRQYAPESPYAGIILD